MKGTGNSATTVNTATSGVTNQGNSNAGAVVNAAFGTAISTVSKRHSFSPGLSSDQLMLKLQGSNSVSGIRNSAAAMVNNTD